MSATSLPYPNATYLSLHSPKRGQYSEIGLSNKLDFAYGFLPYVFIFKVVSFYFLIFNLNKW